SLPVTMVSLIDLVDNKDRLEIIGRLAKRMFHKQQLMVDVETSTDRKSALMDADFVVLQIRVGRQDQRVFDEKIPSEFGLIGHETIGIGGMFNALRTVPVIYDIIEDVKEACPQAWIINVTNPTGIITEAVFRFAEFDRFIGVCNDSIHMTEKL